jgi:putative flippase GtrA
MKSFGTFLIVSGLAAGINFLARAVFERWMPFELAVALAFPVALTFAFVMNKRFVFTSGGGSAVAASQFSRFAIVNIAALVQVWLISVGLAAWFFPAIGWTWRANDIAHAVGLLSPAFTSYLLHKHFSFKTSGV